MIEKMATKGDKWLTDEELGKMCSDPNKINIVSNPLRPGAAIFNTRLEFECFKPDTHRNMLFDFFNSEFGGVLWFTCSIPNEDFADAQRIAGEEKMALAQGYPTLLGPTGMLEFPIHSPNTYTLQNAKDHPCYTDQEAYEAQEAARVQEIWDAHARWWEGLKAGRGETK